MTTLLLTYSEVENKVFRYFGAVGYEYAFGFSQKEFVSFRMKEEMCVFFNQNFKQFAILLLGLYQFTYDLNEVKLRQVYAVQN